MFFDEYSNTETLAEIVKIDPAIAKAKMRLETVTANEEFRQVYETRRKALSDWTTGVNTAFERGRDEGRTEGLISVAKNALAEGASIDFVQKITGLSEAAICALRDKA